MYSEPETKVVFHVKHIGQDSAYAVTGYVLEGYEDESDMFYFFKYHIEDDPDRSLVMARPKFKLTEVEDSKFGFKNKKKNYKTIKEIIPLPQSLSTARKTELDRREIEEPYRDEVDREFANSILPSAVKLLNRKDVDYDFEHLYDLIDAQITGEGRAETT